MFGIILISLGSLFEEVSSGIGKFQVRHRRESIYTMGFLNLFWSIGIFLVLILLFHQPFTFRLIALPIFLCRAVLEIAQAHSTMLAITKADRSTYSLFRTLTIPLLLFADIALAYHPSTRQIAGIIVILAMLVVMFNSRSINRKGLGFVLFTSFNAVITISLYKYNIAHYNSVAAEGLLMSVILIIYFFFTAKKFSHENPFVFLRRRIFLLQSGAYGTATVIESFAYGFAPASIILAGKRSSALFWAIISGKRYFHEKKFTAKIVATIGLVIGIILLI